jgi:FAD-linked sulfhydryl oxidase
MAAYYPENPKPEDEKNVKSFYNLLSKMYPCEYCAQDMRKE